MSQPPSAAGQTVLITGASRGIGLALARRFACHGANLILCARDQAQLKSLAESLSREFPVSVHAIGCDLAHPDGPTYLYDEVERLGLHVDILINNAGMVSFGLFAGTAFEPELQTMQLNMVGLTHLTKRFLQPMLAQGSGRIVNVASLGGYQPGGPMWAVYFASKAYVLSFTKALSVELRGSGVSVTALCPGATRTDFMKQDGLDQTLLYRYFSMDADKVAAIGYRGIMRGKTVVIPGWINKLLALAGELPPRRIALEVNALLVRR